MNTIISLCKECRYFKVPRWGLRPTDFVVPTCEKHNSISAEESRLDPSKCGPEAKNFSNRFDNYYKHFSK